MGNNVKRTILISGVGTVVINGDHKKSYEYYNQNRWKFYVFIKRKPLFEDLKQQLVYRHVLLIAVSSFSGALSPGCHGKDPGFCITLLIIIVDFFVGNCVREKGENL